MVIWNLLCLETILEMKVVLGKVLTDNVNYFCHVIFIIISVVCTTLKDEWWTVAVVWRGSASRLPVAELRGFELTEDYLAENGFRRPIIVRCKDGLDLRVPVEQFSVQDVEQHVGMW